MFNKFKQGISKKSAFQSKTLSLNQLIDALGLQDVDRSALSEATYFACLKVLSESIGKLPLKIQQQTENKGIRIAREHLYYRMLNVRPNKYTTATAFWSTMELFRNHFGNAYAWIDTQEMTAPQLWLMRPQDVHVWYDNACVLSDVPDVYYQYSTPKGLLVLGSEEVLHIRSHNTIDGIVGISVQEQLENTIQSNIKAQKMLSKLYDSGMTAKAVLNYTGGLNDQNVDTLVKGFHEHVSGEEYGIIPVPTGFSLQPLNMKLADSQFLEIKQYSALQIAAAFGVKPYQIGDYTKSSYASAEAQQLAFLTDTLLYIIKQYEEEIAYKLLTDKEIADGYHAKFNTKAILRTDHKTQVETLTKGITNFLYMPNEAREQLDLPAVEGGDTLIGNGNAIPIEIVGQQYTSQE
ncbi:MAG: phage portal protein [Oscillospiraceae bacterium]|nr:phage portal protein [Oscillospiraceae bacterium]